MAADELFEHGQDKQLVAKVIMIDDNTECYDHITGDKDKH